ncbi:MAG: tRNA (adenosine(37)-N6)-threonylcarbamoyltransferase complex dimerization subunit type 1 TsaB [Bdellovibrionota bacterium]|jgi:tRNA threonylcarbamoyl adenosine modification protein YeaZ
MQSILAIDTSTEITFVAVASRDGRSAARSSEVGQHDDKLAEMVQAVLQDAKINAEELDLIGVGAGPGSFTGLRIGLSFASGFAQGLEKPLYTMVSLKAYAEEFKAQAKVVITLCDARRQEMFFASYRSVDLEELSTPQIVNAEELQHYLLSLEKTGVSKEDILIVSMGEVSLPQGYRTEKPKKIAAAIISLIQNGEPPFNRDGAAALLYIRKVAAKTIAERLLKVENS